MNRVTAFMATLTISRLNVLGYIRGLLRYKIKHNMTFFFYGKLSFGLALPLATKSYSKDILVYLKT